MKKETYPKKGIILLSISLLFLSLGFRTRELGEKTEVNFKYETIDIKNMATAQNNVKEAKEEENVVDSLTNIVVNTLSTTKEKVEPINMIEVEMPKVNNSQSIKPVQVNNETFTWYLPTEVGIVTQRPSYSHNALDITSPRGTSERIYPVANGVISGIYTDSFGALIVTVLHNNNGKKYTSQYVHLSRYEHGIYVGKEVTPNDTLGYMGTTGYSTGVHLHLTVLECGLFEQNDPFCSDLNGFFRLSRNSFRQGLRGLESYREVPYSWYSR